MPPVNAPSRCYVSRTNVLLTLASSPVQLTKDQHDVAEHDGKQHDNDEVLQRKIQAEKSELEGDLEGTQDALVSLVCCHCKGHKAKS